MKLRKEVQWFAEQMEMNLRRNDHKRGWKFDSTNSLINRLYEEFLELEIETKKKFNHENIIKESADVANFAMMIADIANE